VAAADLPARNDTYNLVHDNPPRMHDVLWWSLDQLRIGGIVLCGTRAAKDMALKAQEPLLNRIQRLGEWWARPEQPLVVQPLLPPARPTQPWPYRQLISAKHAGITGTETYALLATVQHAPLKGKPRQLNCTAAGHAFAEGQASHTALTLQLPLACIFPSASRCLLAARKNLRQACHRCSTMQAARKQQLARMVAAAGSMAAVECSQASLLR
jgi:hypothetical protein